MTISAFLSRGTVLVAGLLLVAGCGGSAPEPEVDPTPEEPVAEVVEEPEPPVRDETPKYVDPNIEYASILRPVHFDFDKYAIRSDARPVLEGIANLLRDNGDWKVLIEGHCDERGTAEYNLALGEQRALATKRYLASLGVAESRFQTISYGKERPVALGSNEDAWAKNRPERSRTWP